MTSITEADVKQIVEKALAVHVYEQHRHRNPHFTPPTQAEVEAYKVEANLPLDVRKFMEFYTSNGWMVGKNGMKDWQAAARRAAREWCRDLRSPILKEMICKCIECGRNRRESEMAYVQGRGRRCKEPCK